ncbi:MAG: copper chaperone PCu(A)C [Steroidobacterales bacterium]
MTTGNLLAIAGLLFAAQASAGDVSVSEAWARASAPGQNNAAVSLHITSQRDGHLVAASSTASTSAEIHTMKIDNGMMMMRGADAIPLPARHDVAVGADDHIMLIGLKRPLKAGDSLPLTLTVEFADKSTETVHVQVEVRPQV